MTIRIFSHRQIKKNGGTAYAYTVDLCSRQKIYEAAEKVKSDIGSVHILINNAGIVSGSTLLDTPDDKIIRTYDVNVLAHFWTIKSFLPDMISMKKGHIVNIASLAGHSGMNKLVDYCSSKFAAVGLDESIKIELKVQGHDYIATTVVCPYYINTGMFSGVVSKVGTSTRYINKYTFFAVSEKRLYLPLFVSNELNVFNTFLLVA